MARPRKESEQRSNRREIQVSQEVWDQIRERAKAADMTISAYLLRGIMTAGPVVAPSVVCDLLGELQGLRQDLVRVSENLHSHGDPAVIAVHVDLVRIDRRLVRLAERLTSCC